MSQENSIEIVSVVMGAGDSRLFALSGEYFEIIDAPSPIDVVLSDFNGAQRARMKQASASFYSKGVQYGVIQITSASAQTIRFAYGSGETGTRRATGSVTISGAVALDAATLLALEQINNRPEPSNGNFKSLAALAALTAETIFAPGSNPNGTVLLNAGMTLSQTAGIGGVMIAKSSAPVSTTDGEIILAPQFFLASATNYEYAILPSPTFINAGLGLYLITNSAIAASTSIRHARWRSL